VNLVAVGDLFYERDLADRLQPSSTAASLPCDCSRMSTERSADAASWAAHDTIPRA
jgi:hypothetical protein